MPMGINRLYERTVLELLPASTLIPYGWKSKTKAIRCLATCNKMQSSSPIV